METKRNWSMGNITAEEHIKHDWIFWKYALKTKPRIITKYAEGKKGIDIGAGVGQFSDLLNSEGFDMTALEPNKKLIKDAKCKKVIVEGEHIPFRNKYFDFSIVICTLHHVKNPVKVLKEAKRVSNQIIIQELNRNNVFVPMFTRWNNMRYKEHKEDVNSFYTEEGFKKLLEDAGLEVTHYFKQSVFLVPNVFFWAVCK